MPNLLTKLVKLSYIREPESREQKKECRYGHFNNEVEDKTLEQIQRTYTKQQLREQAEKDNKAHEARLKNYENLPNTIKYPDLFDDYYFKRRVLRRGGMKARRRGINRRKKELLEDSKNKRDWSNFIDDNNFAYDADPINYKQKGKIITVGGNNTTKKNNKPVWAPKFIPSLTDIDAWKELLFHINR